MPYSYLFTEDAAKEYEEAFNWYISRSTFAADKLVLAFAETIKKICKDPYQYRNPYKHFRELAIKKFPYKIIYRIEETKNLVILISLFHNKRNPKEKYSSEKVRSSTRTK